MVTRSVTVFGNAAIITQVLAGPGNRTADYILSYDSSGWHYSPADLGIYHRGSVSADIAAAKAVGLCAGWRVF